MSTQPTKTYLDAQKLLEDSFRLGEMVLESNFKPTFMIAIWRGGVPMGIAIQDFLAFHGIETDHISIRSASYPGIDNQQHRVKVLGIKYLVNQLQQTDKLLIVDDVFDTGRSIEAILTKLKKLTRRNMPSAVRIAVPYYKPSRNKTDRIPDYYLYETEAWLKYPHSLEGLSHEEIKKHRPKIYDIIKDHLS